MLMLQSSARTWVSQLFDTMLTSAGHIDLCITDWVAQDCGSQHVGTSQITRLRGLLVLQNLPVE